STDPAPTASYTLSLHDALPILFLAHVLIATLQHLDEVPTERRFDRFADLARLQGVHGAFERRHRLAGREPAQVTALGRGGIVGRSEEHTSELQSRENLVCRLLL